VSAGIQSILKDYVKQGNALGDLPKYTAIHINDTHPALCVPELMRILVDEYSVEWEKAWHITINTLSYTNHTIMPEALEKWPVIMYKQLLPRVYQITEEINRRLRAELFELFPGDTGKVEYMLIIQKSVVNMANMCIAGSHSVNGVAAVHSKILRDELFHDYYMAYPERFNNKTNGVTHRRWLVLSNPGLTKLLSDSIGKDFIKKPLQLSKITERGLHNDKAFLESLAAIKHKNKELLSNFLHGRNESVLLDPHSLFDVQVKRIHAYKRQLLKAFHILDLYFDLKDNPNKTVQPITFLFGGKAAPGYAYAKLIIKFINSVAGLVNGDPRTKGLLTVLFMENYNVSMAQRVFPASDISQQISTASKEASGTGNMKFMMNGAVTVGTMDGANIEIAEAVGDENIFTFGMSVSEVLEHYRARDYRSANEYDANYKLRRIMDTLKGDFYKDAKYDEFKPIFDSLTAVNDEYFVLKDFNPYIEAMDKAMAAYCGNQNKWLSMSAVNIAMSGRFSSDETIKQYASEIWGIKENKVREI
jgi:starch phosphorylase